MARLTEAHATWAALAITFLGGAVSYGMLTQRVTAAEEAIKDAKPVTERLATLEANQTNTAKAVDDLKSDVKDVNNSVQALIIELQRQRATPPR